MNKPLNDYKIGDEVKILTSNPELSLNSNQNFWHDGVVVDIRTIHPEFGSRHKPYPIIVVKFNRTYVKAESIYKDMQGIKVFVDYDLTYYKKESQEGFFYTGHIKPRNCE